MLKKFDAMLGQEVPFTEDELLHHQAALAAAAEQEQAAVLDGARAERNKLLAESDWTQMSDAPVDRAAWAEYRQKLRDITTQPGFPADIVWPEQPT
jgi:hypothetical protein